VIARRSLPGPALTQPARRDPPGWSRLCPVSRDHPAALPGPALTRPARRGPAGRPRLCPVSRDRPAVLLNGPAPDPAGPQSSVWVVVAASGQPRLPGGHQGQP